MEESAEKENGKSFDEIKQIVIFLASGVFVKFHKEFLAPSTELSSNFWVDIANISHHVMHFLISTAIQLVLFLWLMRIIVAVYNLMCGEEKSRGG